jgi:chaperonin cofactor prefoldin
MKDMIARLTNQATTIEVEISTLKRQVFANRDNRIADALTSQIERMRSELVLINNQISELKGAMYATHH